MEKFVHIDNKDKRSEIFEYLYTLMMLLYMFISSVFLFADETVPD